MVIVNYRTSQLTLACLKALGEMRAALPGLTAIIVDGGSGDGSAEALERGIGDLNVGAWAELLPLPLNGGFGYANNQALLLLAGRAVPPEFVWLLNPDARPLPESLPRLAALLEAKPRAGAVGARLQGQDGKLQGSAFSFPTIRGELSRGCQTDAIRRLVDAPDVVYAPEAASQVPWVTGAAVLLRWAALRETGIFDDGFFLYFEEVELMHRLRDAGWEIWHEPAAHVEHIGGAATDVRWDEAGYHKPAALPRYWYQSRRRYLVRTGGIGMALLATAAFLLGRAMWLLRVGIERRPDPFPHRTFRDTVLHSWWPSRSDRVARAAPTLSEAPGSEPRWMKARGADSR